MAINWKAVRDGFLPPAPGMAGVSLADLRERRRLTRFVGLLLVTSASAGLAGLAQLAQGFWVSGALALFTGLVLARALYAVRRGNDGRPLVVMVLIITGLLAAAMGVAAGRGGLISLFWMSLLAPVALSLSGPRVAAWTLGVTVAVITTAMWVIFHVDYVPPLAVDALGAHLISLVGAVLTTYALIRAYDRQTEADFDELERRNTEMTAARAAADTASRTKSEFLATMSHEIRTPMNGVLGMTSVMLGLKGLPPEVREGLTTIQQSGSTLMAVINDILDFSKIESGRMVLEREPIDLRAEFSALKALLEGVATEHDNHFVLTISDEVPSYVAGDPVRLRQVALNLLSNALKFTTVGRVDARLLVREGQLVLEVTDSGIGMSPQVLERLFQPFTQADASTTRRFGGTGLGLAIVRRLVDAMKGTITATSVVGRGSTFTVTLPMDVVPPPPNATPTPVRAARTLRVLLAEDNPINQRVARGLLEQLGHEVVMADDGQQALDRLTAADFDIILMDCHMPVMDGFEATRIVRERKGRTQPIIALTAASLPEEQSRCLEAGMDAVLLKPVRREDLRAMLERYSGSRVAPLLGQPVE
jgi:signal transduction histidine kinase/ActR/RegA family two-component response regulator